MLVPDLQVSYRTACKSATVKSGSSIPTSYQHTNKLTNKPVRRAVRISETLMEDSAFEQSETAPTSATHRH